MQGARERQQGEAQGRTLNQRRPVPEKPREIVIHDRPPDSAASYVMTATLSYVASPVFTGPAT
ncbi:hypothetical protein Kisp02_41070 [Kineosporia sp. NBRC 101731]|nr:hypothetical protein Kisp02_41070 [Kineosporia sp. NBRC 101731]